MCNECLTSYLYKRSCDAAKKKVFHDLFQTKCSSARLRAKNSEDENAEQLFIKPDMLCSGSPEDIN